MTRDEWIAAGLAAMAFAAFLDWLLDYWRKND
jgi:hypothetical protein